MIARVDSRSLRRFAACLTLGGGLLWADLAAAQGIAPFLGFTSLPSFAWPDVPQADETRWAASYAGVSTGYAFSSSKRFGSYGGPTVGFEGGRMWQEGRFVYGVVGGFDYLSAMGGSAVPGFGRLAYSRDFAGALQVKAGALLTPDVLVYGKLGAWAVHDQLRLGATSTSQSFSRDGIAIQPDARVGVEWAVTDRLSIAVEAGVTGGGLNRW
ncbi:outer membrane protein [Methylobacterium haplocladii]|uniref:Outer membrane protein OmpA-like transmembrane domain-containing protein n=1 Tax=Methylobacterium haplocladii TaxID=1176176 RepID=A0A512IKG4_9HYPH|nr:hypothetical protein [Methylobacterium haplocladii]GEO98207.1 hypothetical protein MHA02_05950 [Methylobacterium haplocladii]GJD84398.1 hypothetical protein HPGCJGGD_2274 [Methylobacterium haplocladii]GLS60940.1 hypothetical protein GCM10007887_36310 [Methylobacterium haplocladii]